MDDYLLLVFKLVSVIFALSAVVTGVQSVVDPVGFSNFFGLPVPPPVTLAVSSDADPAEVVRLRAAVTGLLDDQRALTMSYISLMGVRQLATGIILLTFAYQHKWTEAAVILAIIGTLVAGTDGIYLYSAGHTQLGQFHAIPGAVIAALAAAVIYSTG